MRPSGIKGRLWRNALSSAAAAVLFRMVCALVLLWLRGRTEIGWVRWLLLALAVGNLITIPPVFAVLRQRKKEIEGGELDAAGKY